MENRQFICIRCPRGCEIHCALEGKNLMTLSGNMCRLGEEYVKSEITHPMRIVTTTVRLRGGTLPLLPVWTSSPIPKDKVFELLSVLRGIEVSAPVANESVVVKDALGLGVDVIASRSIDKME